MLDLGELVKRAIKYLVEGLMVAIAAYAIPKKALNLDEVSLIALTAAAKWFASFKTGKITERSGEVDNSLFLGSGAVVIAPKPYRPSTLSPCLRLANTAVPLGRLPHFRWELLPFLQLAGWGLVELVDP